MEYKKTNWDLYYTDDYKQQYFFSKFTRAITEKQLLHFIKKHIKTEDSLRICELGGGDSCFFRNLKENLNISEYAIYDFNEKGINRFLNKASVCVNDIKIKAFYHDLLNEDLYEFNCYDIVFSVGLIEHFDKVGTSKVISKHFQLVKSDGIIIISTPTPTILYRTIRFFSEILGKWIFYDERPIKKRELNIAVNQNGGFIIDSKTIYLIGLTQYMCVIKKNNKRV